MLRFTPTAWAKLLYLCHLGDTEIAGFGVRAANDLLLAEQFLTIKQQATAVTVDLDDEAVADFFDQQVELGNKPEQFARVWAHTHPGDCPNPSATDEETFSRVFGRCDWAVMFIMARNGATYARLRFNVGPKSEMVIPVEVDYSRAFAGTDELNWKAEYENNVEVGSLFGAGPTGLDAVLPERNDFLDQFDVDRQFIEQMYADGDLTDQQLALLLDEEDEEPIY